MKIYNCGWVIFKSSKIGRLCFSSKLKRKKNSDEFLIKTILEKPNRERSSLHFTWVWLCLKLRPNVQNDTKHSNTH